MGRNYRQQDLRGQPGRGNSVCEGVELCLRESQYWKRRAQVTGRSRVLIACVPCLFIPNHLKLMLENRNIPPPPPQAMDQKGIRITFVQGGFEKGGFFPLSTVRIAVLCDGENSKLQIGK